MVARARGPLANVYNPAGLASAVSTEINGSSTGFQLTSLGLKGVGPDVSSSRIVNLGGFLGVVIANPVIKTTKWRLGFSVFSPLGWEPGIAVRGGGRRGRVGRQLSLDYRTQVRLRAQIPSLAAGLNVSKRFRVGAGLQVPIVNILQQQQSTSLSNDATEAATITRTFAADGNVWLVRLIGGVQWDPIPAVSVGLTAETGTARLWGSSFYSDQLNTAFGNGFETVSFRDPSARMDYKLPFALKGGVAARIGKVEIEANVRWYSSIGEFDLYRSDSVGIALSQRDRRRAETDAGDPPAGDAGLSLGGEPCLRHARAAYAKLAASRGRQQRPVAAVGPGPAVPAGHVRRRDGRAVVYDGEPVRRSGTRVPDGCVADDADQHPADHRGCRPHREDVPIAVFDSLHVLTAGTGNREQGTGTTAGRGKREEEKQLKIQVRAVVLTSFIFLPRVVAAQIAAPPAGFSVSSWTTADGLPQSSIAGLARDREGYLWVGTAAGLARFDGDSFVTYPRDPAAEPFKTVSEMTTDASGAIWVAGADSGIARLDQYGRLTPLTVPPVPRPLHLAVGPADSVWMAFFGQVWLHTGNHWHQLAAVPDDVRR